MKTLITSAAIAVAAIVAAPVSAAPVILNVTGTAGTAGSFSGTLNLDVENGVAESGTGTLSIAGLTDAPVTLITNSTPGNNPSQYGPIGYRANDGTDLLGGDQAFPISNNGLFFAVGTTAPTSGSSPLIIFYSNNDGTFGSLFDGNVNGTEYYLAGYFDGTAEISQSAVPEPATWAMMVVGFGMVGFGLRRRAASTRVSFA